MSDDNRVAKGLFVGFLTGAVAGGILALLYAPKSGRELRGDLKKKSDEISQDVEKYLADAQVKAKDLINEGKEKSADLVTDAKKKADALLHDAESLLTDAKKKMQGESVKLKSAVKAGVDAFKEERSSSEEKST